MFQSFIVIFGYQSYEKGEDGFQLPVPLESERSISSAVFSCREAANAYKAFLEKKENVYWLNVHSLVSKDLFNFCDDVKVEDVKGEQQRNIFVYKVL